MYVRMFDCKFGSIADKRASGQEQVNGSVNLVSQDVGKYLALVPYDSRDAFSIVLWGWLVCVLRARRVSHTLAFLVLLFIRKLLLVCLGWGMEFCCFGSLEESELVVLSAPF